MVENTCVKIEKTDFLMLCTCSVIPLPPIQLMHLEAVASATVVAKNLHMAASFTTGRPIYI